MIKNLMASVALLCVVGCSDRQQQEGVAPAAEEAGVGEAAIAPDRPGAAPITRSDNATAPTLQAAPQNGSGSHTRAAEQVAHPGVNPAASEAAQPATESSSQQ